MSIIRLDKPNNIENIKLIIEKDDDIYILTKLGIDIYYKINGITTIEGKL